MRKKYIRFVIFLSLFFIPLFYTLAVTSSAGFIPGNIWYSTDFFKEGDKVKIYTMIYNQDQRQLSGTVFFFDKTTFLGNKDFIVSGKGLKDISIDWTVTVGDHLIFGQIQNSKFLNSDNKYENVLLTGTKTLESKITVSKKIAANAIDDTLTPVKNKINEVIIPNVQNFVTENTPEVVSKTIEGTSSAIENFRQNITTISTNKKEEVANQIKELGNTKSTSKTNLPNNDSIKDTLEKNTSIMKPFKYTELFALSLFSTVFNNKYIFYSLIAIVIFFIFRFIIKRLF